MSPDIDDKPSWVTTRRGQFIGGTIIATCIFFAFLFPTLYVQSESDKRADADRSARIENDQRIEVAQVDIACAFIKGLEKAFKPGTLTGQEDEITRKRILDNNAQRAAAIATVRGEMPDGIKAKINAECPPVSA